MKKWFYKLIGIILIVFVCCSGIFEKVSSFFVWLVTLNLTSSTISIVSEIIVKILCFVISYSLVGIIFNGLRFYNKRYMSLAYFIISTIVSFGLAYLFMLFERYWLIFIVVFSLITISLIGFQIYFFVHKTENEIFTD